MPSLSPLYIDFSSISLHHFSFSMYQFTVYLIPSYSFVLACQPISEENFVEFIDIFDHVQVCLLLIQLNYSD